jgi:hypothetical protein
MKLGQEVKKVTYFGIKLNIPKGYRYVATDSDGRVYAFKHKPNTGNSAWVCVTDNFSFVVDVELEGEDWRDTLVSYKKLSKKKLKAFYESFGKSGWFATDKDGSVFWYKNEPELETDWRQKSTNPTFFSDHSYMGQHNSINYKKSLMEIK